MSASATAAATDSIRSNERESETSCDGVDDQAIVDCLIEVVRRGLVDVELDVVQEHLAVALLVLEDAVAAEDLEAVELQLHASALTTASASTVS